EETQESEGTTLIATFDATTVAVAAITAFATIVGAYLGYLSGSETKKAQQARAKAELEKLQLERAEADRDARARLYKEFLDAERGQRRHGILDAMRADVAPDGESIFEVPVTIEPPTVAEQLQTTLGLAQPEPAPETERAPEPSPPRHDKP